MKKRRSLITILMVCLIALVGIGYANITRTLTINGTSNATVEDSNFKVVFDTAEKDTVTNCTITDLKEASATITVDGSELTTTGNTATATLTIKNTSAELGASLTAEVTNTNETYFGVTYSFDEESIAAKGSTTITVTVTLLKTPIAEVTGTFTVTITATATVA